MFGFWKVLEKEKKNMKKNGFFYIWFYYEKYKKKLSIIKIIKKLVYY